MFFLGSDEAKSDKLMNTPITNERRFQKLKPFLKTKYENEGQEETNVSSVFVKETELKKKC